MENQFFRCTQRAITQCRVITLGPIFIKMVLNRAQGLKKKVKKFQREKIITGRAIIKNVEGGGRIPPPPPGSFRVNTSQQRLDAAAEECMLSISASTAIGKIISKDRRFNSYTV